MILFFDDYSDTIGLLQIPTHISQQGGLCFKDGSLPNVFSFSQLEICDQCTGTGSEECQVCPTSGKGQQCYFPYG